MYDPKLTKPPQDFSKGIPKATVTPKPADDQEIDLDTWDDMVADKFKVPKSLMKAVRGQESGGDIGEKRARVVIAPKIHRLPEHLPHRSGDKKILLIHVNEHAIVLTA
jgi:hypothetical protein